MYNFYNENDEINENTENDNVYTNNEYNDETNILEENSEIDSNNKSPKKKHRLLKLILILFLTIVLGLLGIFGYYFYSLSPITSESSEVIVTIKKGSSISEIADTLKEHDLIKSTNTFRAYIKYQSPKNNLQAGTYKLNKNMSVEEILNSLNEGSNYYPDLVNITFLEGKNMRWIAKKIASNTNNSYDSVFEVLENESYINSLINKYWFLSKEVNNSQIYYPLEGYLFPDTYTFKDKDVKVETIFETMLDQMDKKLTPLRTELSKSKYSIHQILTLASVIEAEGADKDSRSLISSVFYNRLNSNMSLGSDVTTYYAVKVDMSERDLYRSEINSYNPYNTRGPNMNGKLPVGPICSSSIESIKAAITPEKSDYLYFVADKNGKVYFTKSNNEHIEKVKELKANNLWFNY